MATLSRMFSSRITKSVIKTAWNEWEKAVVVRATVAKAPKHQHCCARPMLVVYV